MGTVYRARDLETGQTVAVKILPGNLASEHQRFVHEAHTLVELSHPAIVGYVAHGVDDGQRFLAMEWLEGEDLADRLARRGLTVEESIALGRRAAAGLAAAHARGIVHRDVKPSNLLLVGGDPARTKVIDFGVARLGNRTAITRSGVVVGTAGYMAPEQARAAHETGPRADVFALGCVLYECLTGRPAFTGDHVLAVLAKVMLEASPRVSASRANVPPALDDLVARMLAKDPNDRPESAQEVLAVLEEVNPVTHEAPRAVSLTPRPLTTGEQRFLSIVVVDFDVLSVTTQTVTPEQAESDTRRVRELADRFDAQLTSLGEGTQVLTLATHGGATAQSARAATVALLLKETFPLARVALATGRAATHGGLPVGPVIDRATALIVTSSDDKSHVRIDDVTASLLGPHFRVKRAGDMFVLLDAESSGDVVRPLLGRPTPCVGREKELALLEATLRESATEPVARAVLLTAAPGTGKSRVRQELVARAKRGSDLTVLSARADPVGAGSALGIVRRLVRKAAELHDREPPAEQHARLRARLGEHLTGSAWVEVAEFLGELAGAPSDAPSPELRAARNDPRILSERMRRAFVAWLAAECAARPVLVAVEDLHWGDLASVSYLGEALRELAEKPLMVLAVARPEVHDLFPKLWASEGVQEIRLGGLTRSASERLARAVLGDNVPKETMARIIERADGNAFYLEELIRRVAAGAAEDLPETVLAMVEARLSALEPEARRVLRAASVFGEQLWEGGAVALLGEGTNAAEVASWMRVLVDRELLVPGRNDKFPGEVEYVFRHGLVRDAAYGMLTDADRQAGHALAATWLENAGERDPLVLAEHYERGGDLGRAVPWITRAALAAREGGSVQEALGLVERALVAKPEGEALGLLRALEGECLAWTLDWPRCLESSRSAVNLLPRHSPHWFLAVSATIYAGSTSGQIGAMLDLVDIERDFTDAVPTSGPFALGLAVMVLGLLLVGQRERAFQIADALEATAARRADADPSFSGWCRVARSLALLYGRDDPGGALVAIREALALHKIAGDPVGTATAALLLAQTLVELGAYEEGIRASLECEAYAEKRGLVFVRDWAVIYRARALVRTGRSEEGLRLLEPVAIDTGDLYRHLLVRTLQAEGSLRLGRLDEAETRARAVLDLDVPLPGVGAAVNDVLARVALARGRADEAVAFAEAGLVHQACSGLSFIGSTLHASRLAGLRALGRAAEARAEERFLRDRAVRIAASTPEAYRAGFLDAEPHRI